MGEGVSCPFRALSVGHVSPPDLSLVTGALAFMAGLRSRTKSCFRLETSVSFRNKSSLRDLGAVAGPALVSSLGVWLAALGNDHLGLPCFLPVGKSHELPLTTCSDGCLGSNNDEGRSEV